MSSVRAGDGVSVARSFRPHPDRHGLAYPAACVRDAAVLSATWNKSGVSSDSSPAGSAIRGRRVRTSRSKSRGGSSLGVTPRPHRTFDARIKPNRRRLMVGDLPKDYKNRGARTV